MEVLRLKVYIIDASGKLTHFSQLIASQDIEQAKKELPGNAYAFTFIKGTRNPHGKNRGRFSGVAQCSPIYNKNGEEICQKQTDQAFLDAQQKAVADGLPNSIRKP